ncbi:hypothetical protein LXL04_017629 [Taraxacum kok-saghyz]
MSDFSPVGCIRLDQIISGYEITSDCAYLNRPYEEIKRLRWPFFAHLTKSPLPKQKREPSKTLQKYVLAICDHMAGARLFDFYIQKVSMLQCCKWYDGKKIVANIAKQPRSSNLPRSRLAPRPASPRQKVDWSTKDSRSFADVLGGKTQVNPAPTVNIREVTEIISWAGNSALIGEAKDFNALCNFPALVNYEGLNILEVKYFGGMQILMKFNTGKASDMFKVNKNIWLKWFTKVHQLANVTGSFKRIAWLKIIGMPILAWDESNFASIAGRFGKVLSNNVSFWNCSDLSHVKVGVLTTSLKRVEETLAVNLKGVGYSIGVFEIDEEWTPFSPTSFPPSDSDDEDDRNGDEDDEISDTHEHMEEDLEDVTLELRLSGVPVTVTVTFMENRNRHTGKLARMGKHLIPALSPITPVIVTRLFRLILLTSPFPAQLISPPHSHSSAHWTDPFSPNFGPSTNPVFVVGESDPTQLPPKSVCRNPSSSSTFPSRTATPMPRPPPLNSIGLNHSAACSSSSPRNSGKHTSSPTMVSTASSSELNHTIKLGNMFPHECALSEHKRDDRSPQNRLAQTVTQGLQILFLRDSGVASV